jgi:hypothetical protein
MKRGYLSQYFESAAAKRLTAVEVDPHTSHGHELNSIKELKQIFGAEDLREIPAVFLWFGQENEGVSNRGKVSWYDARRNDPKRSAEWRLYYDDKEIIQDLAKTNDTVFVAKRTDGLIMMIVTAGGSTIESQLFWLFGLKPPNDSHFEFSEIQKDSDSEIGFVSRFILDELGIEVEEPEANKLDELLAKFKGILPSTHIFSEYTRSILKDVNPLDDPDAALMAWLDQEEKMFRRMERHIVSTRLREGFVSGDNTDVDGFISFSLHVQNRRKSRAGFAFENHLEALFTAFKLRFQRGAITEGKSKPDFLFPGAKEYHANKFPAELLTMLGAKTSCKDRWRQVSSEASRIEPKHLLTLEPGITLNQTNEMQAAKVQLVLPSPIHTSYLDEQKTWLMNLKQFIGIVQERQRKYN